MAVDRWQREEVADLSEEVQDLLPHVEYAQIGCRITAVIRGGSRHSPILYHTEKLLEEKIAEELQACQQ